MELQTLPKPAQAFVALGANLDDPADQVERAFPELARLPQTQLRARSSLYLTKPVGYTDQPDFINAVALIETTLSPRQLLDQLLAIEQRHGRRREFRNAPRTLDLDLLLYDHLVMHEPGLTLPHPRMHERAFVLAPLLEIAPDCIIPGAGAAATALHRIDASDLRKLAPIPTTLSACP